jgi:hypothetical protein
MQFNIKSVPGIESIFCKKISKMRFFDLEEGFAEVRQAR